MEAFGPHHVGMPHTRLLGDKLWEMRFNGKAGIGRAMYTAVAGKRLLVLHAFVKKTGRTPPRAIELALKRLKEIAT